MQKSRNAKWGKRGEEGDRREGVRRTGNICEGEKYVFAYFFSSCEEYKLERATTTEQEERARRSAAPLRLKGTRKHAHTEKGKGT